MNTLTLIPDTGSLDALVLNVVDADTIDVGLLVPVRIRLHGVQAPERGTERGRLATQLVREQIGRQVVGLTLHGRDKYGRLLADVAMGPTMDLATALLDAGLAVEWDGKGPRPVGGSLPDADDSGDDCP